MSYVSVYFYLNMWLFKHPTSIAEVLGWNPIGPQLNLCSRTTHILLDSDYFTRWPEAYATADHKTETVASKLINERVPCFGVIQHLHTDKGQYLKAIFSRT